MSVEEVKKKIREHKVQLGELLPLIEGDAFEVDQVSRLIINIINTN